uniref:major intrinsically disordered NOTCH2-binding receptor 1-like n=1 Tax=Myxine glutinosa TaxID=7769 RepID=UPI00359022C7
MLEQLVVEELPSNDVNQRWLNLRYGQRHWGNAEESPSLVRHNPLFWSELEDTGRRDGPCWSIQDLAGKVDAAQEHAATAVLGPDSLTYWMEESYTPGYDALLRRHGPAGRLCCRPWVAAVLVLGILVTTLLALLPALLALHR